MKFLGSFDSCSLCGGGHHREECPNRAARASERPVHSANHYCGMCRESYAPADGCRCPDAYATQELPCVPMAVLMGFQS